MQDLLSLLLRCLSVLQCLLLVYRLWGRGIKNESGYGLVGGGSLCEDEPLSPLLLFEQLKSINFTLDKLLYGTLCLPVDLTSLFLGTGEDALISFSVRIVLAHGIHHPQNFFTKSFSGLGKFDVQLLELSDPIIIPHHEINELLLIS